MKKDIDILIRPGAVSISIPLMFSALLWIVSYLLMPQADWGIAQNTPFSAWLNGMIPSNTFVSHITGYLFSVFIGLFLVQFNESFSVIRTRTMLPMFFFIILMSANINAHEFSFGQLSCVFLLLALWQVCAIYQKGTPVKQTFNIGFFLAAGSFFTVELLLFIPIFWVGMIRLNSFTMRTFLASIVGFLSPFILFLGIAYLQSDVSIYINLLIDQFRIEFSFMEYNFIFILFLSSTIIISIIAIGNSINNSFSDKIKVSRMLGFISICYLLSTLLFLFMSNKSAIMYTLSSIFAALLYAHYFSLHYNVFIRILFWVQIIMSGIFFLSSIFFS